MVFRIACTARGPLAQIRSAISWALASAFAIGYDVPDQSELLGLWRLDVATGQQQVRGDGVGELAGEPDRGAAQRVEAPLGFGDPEPGALSGHPDVGALEDLGAAGDGRPLHCGDQRLGEPEALEQRLDHRGVVLPPDSKDSAAASRHRLQVGAGTEVAAGAGQDAHPDLSSLLARSQASPMIASISPDSALRDSGRFMVTTRVCPSCSTRQCGCGRADGSRVMVDDSSRKQERVLVLRRGSEHRRPLRTRRRRRTGPPRHPSRVTASSPTPSWRRMPTDWRTTSPAGAWAWATTSGSTPRTASST